MKRKAFGLIEAVLASGILALVAGASLALSGVVLRGSVELADRTAAVYLAVDALEAVQNIRDTNYIDENPATGWDNGLPDGANYQLSVDGITGRWCLYPVVTCPAPSSTDLLQNNIQYTRNITISTVGERKRVEAQVGWTVAGGSRSVAFSTFLANVQQP